MSRLRLPLRVHTAWVLAALGAGSLIAVLSACAVGAVSISFADQFSILARWATGQSGGGEFDYIYLSIRLPRVMTAYLVGMSLACVGALFQSLLRNPLAEPYIVGVSPGASLGATVFLGMTASGGTAAVSGSGLGGMLAFAFVGGIVAVGAAYILASQGKFLSLADILLAGIAIGSICTAVTSYLWIHTLQDVRALLYWLMGNLSGKGWSHVLLVAELTLPIVAISWRLANGLNIMLLGEEHAAYLGMNVERFKRWLLAIGTLAAATTVAVAGVIGFVGIIVPHIVRRLVGADNRKVIPAASLFGGVFLVVCDLLARALFAPLELPVGLLTAFLGAPFFLYVLRQTHAK